MAADAGGADVGSPSDEDTLGGRYVGLSFPLPAHGLSFPQFRTRWAAYASGCIPGKCRGVRALGRARLLDRLLRAACGCAAPHCPLRLRCWLRACARTQSAGSRMKVALRMAAVASSSLKLVRAAWARTATSTSPRTMIRSCSWTAWPRSSRRRATNGLPQRRAARLAAVAVLPNRRLLRRLPSASSSGTAHRAARQSRGRPPAPSAAPPRCRSVTWPDSPRLTTTR